MSLLFRGKSMSKLKFCLFLIFLAVWKFQIRDRGRGGYCGSSWISLSSVHFCTHSLQFLQPDSIVNIKRACQYRACHAELVNTTVLQLNTRRYTSMDHLVITAHSKLYNCQRKLCYKAKMLCLLLFQCKLHWVALHRISGAMFRDSYCWKQEAGFGGCSVIAEKSALIWQRNVRLPFHHITTHTNDSLYMNLKESCQMNLGLWVVWVKRWRCVVQLLCMYYVCLKSKMQKGGSICFVFDIKNVAFSLCFGKMV